MDTHTIGKHCPFCGTYNEVTVPVNEYINWQMGDLIQDAFKSLSTDDREIIKTGICNECWPKDAIEDMESINDALDRN